MRVTVFGPGGVGGYLAARLEASPDVELSIVGRGEHLRAIQTGGLSLRSPLGDVDVTPFATDDPATIGVVDLVLLAVKAHDVAQVVPRLRPLIGPGTSVMTLQNGVESPARVGEVLGSEAVITGVAYIFSAVDRPGRVVHHAGPARLVFGDPPASRSGRAEKVAELLETAGIGVEVVEDAEAAMWSKFVVLCATAGVTATSRLPVDVLRQDPATRSLFRDLAREVVAVGRANGIAVPDEAVDRAMRFIDDVGPEAYSSLLHDLLHGKPMELELLHGTVVRLGDQLGVPVPASRTIYAVLSPWARRNGRASELANGER